MATVTNKSELLEQVKAAHARMEKLLSTLSPAELSAPVLDEGWSIQDSLAHLVAWEKMMMGMSLPISSARTNRSSSR